MIVIDNNDVLAGDASTDAVVDYVISGFVGTTPTLLAKSQLSDTPATTIYTSGANGTMITSIILRNTHSSAVTVNLLVESLGIIAEDLSLGVGSTLYTDGQRIVVMDKSGQVLSTWAVDDTAVDGETDKPISSNWAYDHAVDLDIHTLNPLDTLKTGEYYSSINSGGANFALAADRLFGMLLVVARDITVDRIAIEVTVADAGKVARLGIYNDGSNLYPGTLVVDGGEISVAANGIITATISEALTKGYYWVAIVSDGTPTIRGYGTGEGVIPQLGPTSTNFSETVRAARAVRAYGALPDPFTGGALSPGWLPKILLRIASLD